LIFESDTLDDKNWVMDFGGLKLFKDWAEDMFDHKLVIAQDDPDFQTLMLLDGTIAEVRVVEAVGCEKFAELCYNKMAEILEELKNGAGRYPVLRGVRLKSAEVFEHAANSAIYEG
jgi:6-pyruvoyltetrahydropterin/6-carboxytetrahydropterin synthase